MRANGKPAEKRRNGHPYPPRSTGSRPGALGRDPVHDRRRSPPKATICLPPGRDNLDNGGSNGPGVPGKPRWRIVGERVPVADL